MEYYKEKYEDALERAKKEYKNHEAFKGFCEMLVHIFPELKESEDERIRKALIQHIKDKVSVISGWRKEELIAWLEKQGEQIDIVNKEYWRGYREGKQEILDKYADLEKQGEQKPATLNDAIGKVVLNPAWSEEDEKFFKTTLWHISHSISNSNCTNVRSNTADWLKSLKERMKGE